MYINPQTIFTLYSGVPFDIGHSHIIRFTSKSAQDAYFAGKVVKSYTDFSYVRENSVVRVPEKADDLIQCNYCSFLNAGFGNKRFYAFITDIEYAANAVTRIGIEIDYVQTFITEWAIGESYVEREHVSDDAIGKHTVEENLPTGDYFAVKSMTYNAGVGIAGYALNTDTGGAETLINNMYVGADVLATQSPATMSNWINGYSETPEYVIMVTMCTADMATGLNPSPVTRNLTFTRTRGAFSYQGQSYTPKNNKLYSYPYRFIMVDNFDGASDIIKWEMFDTAETPNAEFQINENLVPKPYMEIFPLDYSGEHTASGHAVAYENFPQCIYSTDAFKAWVSQEMPRGIANTGMNIITGIGGGAIAQGSIGALVGGTASGASSIINMGMDYKYHKLHSEAMGGTIGSAGGNYANGRVGFRIREMSIKPEYAKIVDSYFTRFGYKVDSYKVPNLTGHPEFNYVKCYETSVSGNVPEECITQVSEMFNKGVTIHHGDY